MRFESKIVITIIVIIGMVVLSAASLYDSYKIYITRKSNINYIANAVAAENRVEGEDIEKLTEVVDELDKLISKDDLSKEKLLHLNKKLEEIDNVQTTSSELLNEKLEVDISTKIKEMSRNPKDIKSQKFLKYVIENFSPINFAEYKKIRAADEGNQLKMAEYEMMEDLDLAEGYANGTNYTNKGRCEANAKEVVDILDEIASDINFFLESRIFSKLVSEFNEEITESDLKEMKAAINDLEYKRLFNTSEYCLLQIVEYFIDWQSEGRANIEEAKKMLSYLYKTLVCADLEGKRQSYGCLGYMIFIVKIMHELNQ